MDKDLERMLREQRGDLKERLYHVLETTPRISGHHNGSNDYLEHEEIVKLVFGDGEISRLRVTGRVYDYIVGAPEKYSAPTSKEQIKTIVKNKGILPVKIKYTSHIGFNDPEHPQKLVLSEASVEVDYLDEEVQKRIK